MGVGWSDAIGCLVQISFSERRGDALSVGWFVRVEGDIGSL